MNFAALLLSLGLMGMVYSRHSCGSDCKPAARYCRLDIKQMPELQHSSVAPWNLSIDTKEGRDPQHIKYAVCKDCTVEHTVAKPIYVQVFVHQRTSDEKWCRCPFKLAVGCTCVKTQ